MLKWCHKFLTLGEHKVVNLSITWCNLSLFKSSIGPSPSLFSKCLDMFYSWIANPIANILATNVWPSLELFNGLSTFTFTTNQCSYVCTNLKCCSRYIYLLVDNVIHLNFRCVNIERWARANFAMWWTKSKTIFA